MLPLPPNWPGLGVDGFTPNKLLEVVPGAGLVDVVPPPNRLPVAGMVVVVVPDAGVAEVAPKSELDGVEPKMFAGVVEVVPVVPVPVPVPVAGVVVVVVLVWPNIPPPPKGLGLVPPPPLVPEVIALVIQNSKQQNLTNHCRRHHHRRVPLRLFHLSTESKDVSQIPSSASISLRHSGSALTEY